MSKEAQFTSLKREERPEFKNKSYRNSIPNRIYKEAPSFPRSPGTQAIMHPSISIYLSDIQEAVEESATLSPHKTQKATGLV